MSDIIYYKKQGKRYVPANVYSERFSRSMPVGSTLSVVRPNGTSRVFNIEPEFAPITAAALHARQEITDAILQAATARPATQVLSDEQREAWNNFIKVMGVRGRYIEYPSAMEVCDVVTQTLESEAKKMLEVPAVKEAYEHFLFLYKITKENNVNE